MSIIRAPRPDSGFTLVENAVIRDSRLSWRARGILIGLLSHTEDWRTDSTQIAREGKEGREAVRAALRELEACGYLVRVKERAEGGRWVTNSYVFDRPQDVSAGHTEDGFPGAGSPGAGNLGALRSTKTQDQGEDEEKRVAHGATADRPAFEDWRAADRALFRGAIDGAHLRSDGTGPWKEGTWSVDAFYDAFRKRTRGKPLDWPGRYLSGMAETNGVENWLSSNGLEAVG